MALMSEVRIGPLQTQRFAEVASPDEFREFARRIEEARQFLRGRAVWNVNSTAAGGGVAEMLHSLLAYARGAGVDARWWVVSGDAHFYEITKRIHNRLHGSPGDGGPLGAAERDHFADMARRNAEEMAELVQPHDIVLLHDPQTAGMADAMLERGAIVVWRCHIGSDVRNQIIDDTWGFLVPFVGKADAFVFHREAFIPPAVDRARAFLIPPSIDAFSVKNQEMDAATAEAILAHAGVISRARGEGKPIFTRMDGTPGRVDRKAEVVSGNGPPDPETPLVVQVSRWDRLKDPVGVLRGFVDHVARGGAQLVLAGPKVAGVADDPEGLEALEEVKEAWRALDPEDRARVHLVSIPMDDLEENAAIVNALQRHAAVIVQKSLREGFGLTVTEAMWKGRPVIASARGGIHEQIADGESGILVQDPTDLAEFGDAISRVLADPAFAQRLGDAAKARVQSRFLETRHLMQYLDVFQKVDR